MTNGREGSSGSGGGSDGKRRRPQSPVLDLKATSVSDGPPVKPAGSATPPESAPGSSLSSESASIPPSATKAPQASQPHERPGSAASDDIQASPGEPASASPPTADPVPGESVEGAEPVPGDPPKEAAGESVDQAGLAPPDRRRSAGMGWIALAAGAGAGAGALALLLVAWLLGIPLGDDTRVTQSADRIAALETRVQELAARPLPGPDARVPALAERVAGLEQSVQQLRALETRLAAAEDTIGKIGSSGAQEASNAQATDAAGQAQIASLEQTTKNLTADVAALRSRLEQMPPQEPGLADRIGEDVAAVNKRIAALEDTAKQLQAALAKPPAPDFDRPARLAAAALALRTAVESGNSYATELGAVRAIAPTEHRLAALEPFAASGLPSVAALAADLRRRIADAAPPAPPPSTDGSWTERLQATWARLVRVRPVDETAPAGGAYGPISDALARGDVAAAVAAAKALPEQSRNPIEVWIERAQRRAAALEAAQDLSRESLASLAASHNEPGRK